MKKLSIISLVLLVTSLVAMSKNDSQKKIGAIAPTAILRKEIYRIHTDPAELVKRLPTVKIGDSVIVRKPNAYEKQLGGDLIQLFGRTTEEGWVTGLSAPSDYVYGEALSKNALGNFRVKYGTHPNDVGEYEREQMIKEK